MDIGLLGLQFVHFFPIIFSIVPYSELLMLILHVYANCTFNRVLAVFNIDYDTVLRLPRFISIYVYSVM